MAADSSAPSSRLYVGNLSWTFTDADLAGAFASYGTVTESKVIFDRATGRSKGFGFVSFDTEAAATNALNEVNGRDMGGRTVRVSYAQPQGARPSGGFGGGGGGGGFGGGGGGGGRGFGAFGGGGDRGGDRGYGGGGRGGGYGGGGRGGGYGGRGGGERREGGGGGGYGGGDY